MKTILKTYTIKGRTVEIGGREFMEGTAVPYGMTYLSASEKKSLGLPRTLAYAIRRDGASTELVTVTNGYTGWVADAIPA
ncbi:MAG: hypothetical protein ACRD4R_12970 [Candidatus Acidiferrales bacterium]